MADGSEIIVRLLERLASMAVQKIGDQVDLVKGVEKEVVDLFEKLKRVQDRLDDAEEKGIQNRAIKDWLKRLQDASYEMDDVLDEWEYATLKLKQEKHKPVCSFLPSTLSCLSFDKLFTRYRVAMKIRQLKHKLDEILMEGEKYELVISQPKESIVRDPSTSFVEVQEICGRGEDKENLLKKLIGDKGSSEAQLGIQIISIVGLGGIGKTTLAQLVYNDEEVKDHYSFRIWISVSNIFNQFAVAKGIIEEVGQSCQATKYLNTLLKCLEESIKGKKFLLVLDDVWLKDSYKWKPINKCLKSGSEGSKILVTTRNLRVADTMGTKETDMHYVGVLSDNECWLIMSCLAFSQRSKSECESFEKIGKEIAIKCKGLPLAAKVLGSLLRNKDAVEGWQNVVNNKIWEEVGDKLNPNFLLSYNELSPRALKRCFSYLNFFPQDMRLEKTHIIKCWLALGYLGAADNGGELEIKGKDYFHYLTMLSLIQEFQKEEHVTYKMHGIIHGFARYLRTGTSDKNVGCPYCSLPLDSTINIKEYHSLVLDGDNPIFICDCLKNLRVLITYRWDGSLKGIEKLIHLRYLHLNGYDKENTAKFLKAILSYIT